MSISFRKNESDLVLVYVPDIADMGSLVSDLSREKSVRLRKTFNFKLENLLPQYSERIAQLGTESSGYLEYDDALHFDKLEFIIGQYIGDYVVLNQSILDINHRFCFSKSIELKARLFVADHNISIPKKMSSVFNSDIYIGGDEAQLGYVSASDYELLVKKFPTTTELKHYSNYRVELLLSDYFDDKFG